MTLIDTHAHLYMKQYRTNLPSIIDEALKAGIQNIIVPSSTPESLSEVVAISDRYEMVYGALGIHPHEAKNFTDETKRFIETNLGSPKILAVGETGLDFHYTFSPEETQINVFRKHIEIAMRFNLPVIIHMRKSFEKIRNVLDSFEKLPKAVIHCFDGSDNEARYFLKKGLFLSFTGAITFRKSEKLEEVVREVPMDNFFLETDSPYLTPEPFRGVTNHPTNIRLIARKIAEIKGFEIEDISRITTRNASLFFALPFDNRPLFYFLRGKTLYLNITNARNNKLDFSHHFCFPYIRGFNLNIVREPEIEKLKQTIQNHILRVEEVVFLDYGEPTLRETVLKQVAAFAKNMKLRTTLNTDGLANKHYQRNFALELGGLFDRINVSLNASTPKEYQHFHRPPYGEESFREVLNFVAECKQLIPTVCVRTVALPDLNIKACRNIVEKEPGVMFETRDFVN